MDDQNASELLPEESKISATAESPALSEPDARQAVEDVEEDKPVAAGVRDIEVPAVVGGADLPEGFPDRAAFVSAPGGGEGGAVPQADGAGELPAAVSGGAAGLVSYTEYAQEVRQRGRLDLQWFQENNWKYKDRWLKCMAQVRGIGGHPLKLRRTALKSFQWFLAYVRVMQLVNSTGYEAILAEFSHAVMDDEYLWEQLPLVFCVCKGFDSPPEYVTGVVFTKFFLDYVSRVGGPFIDKVVE
jgi:hypothetical protein